MKVLVLVRPGGLEHLRVAAHLSGDRAAQSDLAKIGQELGHLLAGRKLDPMVTETVTLKKVPEALSRMAQRHVRGKVVVRF